MVIALVPEKDYRIFTKEGYMFLEHREPKEFSDARNTQVVSTKYLGKMTLVPQRRHHWPWIFLQNATQA